MTRIEERPASPRAGRTRRALDVVDERLGIRALEYPVPEHANKLAWSLGGVTAAALAILVVTGLFLVQFNNPVPEAANESVRYLDNSFFDQRRHTLVDVVSHPVYDYKEERDQP